jgi:hypothetical protein
VTYDPYIIDWLAWLTIFATTAAASFMAGRYYERARRLSVYFSEAISQVLTEAERCRTGNLTESKEKSTDSTASSRAATPPTQESLSESIE